ncbi:MAG: hypothetical protein AB1552_13755 [Nitrospirota bacterium]
MIRNTTISRILITGSNSLIRESMKEIIADNFKFILTSEEYGEDDVLNELGHYFLMSLSPTRNGQTATGWMY